MISPRLKLHPIQLAIRLRDHSSGAATYTVALLRDAADTLLAQGARLEAAIELLREASIADIPLRDDIVSYLKAYDTETIAEDWI